MAIIRAGRWLRHECPDPETEYVSASYGRTTPAVGDVYECSMCGDQWVWRWRWRQTLTGRCERRVWIPLAWWHPEAWALRRARQAAAAQPIRVRVSDLTAQELADAADDDD